MQEQDLDDQPTNGPSSSAPFVARGSALRSALCSAPFLAPPPFAAFPERSRRGGRSSSLAATHRVSTNRERAAPPLPLLTKRDDDPAEDSRGRNSGGSFRREFQAGDSGGRCPSAPLLLLPRFFHPSRGDRGCAVHVGWRVAKMVVGYLLKVASWCKWRRCWCRGVNGVIVEMLVVAMFVVVVVAPK